MTLKCGIVGLPNVGKSTLFNALTSTSVALAGNYPFCTIEPNVGIVPINDERLERLAKIAGSQNVIHACVEFADIAGLVKGASKGDGLGNKFLSHIREVDAIVHVLRSFENDDIIHVHNKVDPIYDMDVIETELTLADLESIERRLPAAEKKYKNGDKSLKESVEVMQAAYDLLSQGLPASGICDNFAERDVKMLQLLTTKPIIYVCNVSESEAKDGNAYSNLVKSHVAARGSSVVVVSAKIEEEISQLPLEERDMFLEELGLKTSGLTAIANACYKTLNLSSYFTIGPKEARAWTFTNGMTAPETAGIIHTDFERGFIRAEVIAYDDYIALGGESGAKDAGKMRLEGKDYVVQDGDVVHFRFNV